MIHGSSFAVGEGEQQVGAMRHATQVLLSQRASLYVLWPCIWTIWMQLSSSLGPLQCHGVLVLLFAFFFFFKWVEEGRTQEEQNTFYVKCACVNDIEIRDEEAL